jgi:hypothetical protein
MATDVAIKHLELLRAVVPAMSRVAGHLQSKNPIRPRRVATGASGRRNRSV